MKRHSSAGYTIIEVMIVLAVTGALFLSSALLLSGKQAQNENNQSIRALEARFQNVTSDVANGFYPNGFNCLPFGTSVKVDGSAKTPGANAGCIFLGKIVNLKATNADIITLVGRQYFGLLNTDVKDLTEASPVVVANGTVNVTEKYNYLYDLRLQSAISIADGVTSYNALAFIVELGGGPTSTNTANGSHGVLLYGIPGNAATNATVDSLVLPNPFLPNSLVQIQGGVRLCMLGGNGKKSEITIGAGNNSVDTNVLIDSGVGSDCG